VAGVPGDESTAEREERLMNIGAAFGADGEAAQAVEPGERALHDPAMTTELVSGLKAAPRNAWGTAPATAGIPAARVVIPLVRVHRRRPLAGPSLQAFDRSDGVEQVINHLRVVPIRCA
jgi:hypothetical protein